MDLKAKLKDGYKTLQKKLEMISQSKSNSTCGRVSTGDRLGLFENIVTMPVQDAFLTGIVSEDKGCVKAFEELKSIIVEAIQEARREGESIIVIDTLSVISSDDYTYQDININPISESYLEYGGVYITHADLLLEPKEYVLIRSKAPKTFIRDSYRGYTIEEIAGASLDRYVASLNTSTQVLSQLNQDVIAMDGLHEKIADGDEEALLTRLETINQIKNNYSTLLIDKDDSYFNITKSLSGAKDVVLFNALDVCAVSRIPYSRLFGRSVSGLSTTGDAELEQYYNTVVTDIRNNYVLKIFNELTLLQYKDKWEFISITRDPVEQKVESETLFKLHELDIISDDEILQNLNITIVKREDSDDSN